MRLRTTKPFIGLFILLLLTISLSHAASAGTLTGAITSQPSSLPANYNYTISFTVNDTNVSLRANVTALFYVNGANIANTTWVNNITKNATSDNTFSTTFSHVYFAYGDTVFTNITFKESLNASSTGSVRSNNLVIAKSTTVLLEPDTLSFFPAIMSDIGSGIGNLIKALLPWIVFFAILAVVIGLVHIIAKNLSGWGKNQTSFSRRRK